MRYTLIALALALLVPSFAAADDQPTRIRVSDLDKTPIAAGPLRIKITKLKGSFLGIGGGSIEVLNDMGCAPKAALRVL